MSDLPLFAFLQPEQIGAWPLLMLPPPSKPEASTTDAPDGNGGRKQQQQPHQQASLEHLIGTLAAFQVHSFVDIYVTQDERNSSQYVLQVRKGPTKSRWTTHPQRSPLDFGTFTVPCNNNALIAFPFFTFPPVPLFWRLRCPVIAFDPVTRETSSTKASR